MTHELLTAKEAAVYLGVKERIAANQSKPRSVRLRRRPLSVSLPDPSQSMARSVRFAFKPHQGAGDAIACKKHVRSEWVALMNIVLPSALL